MDSDILNFCRHIVKTKYNNLNKEKVQKIRKYYDLPAAASVCYGFNSKAQSNSQSPFNIRWNSTLQKRIRRLRKIGQRTKECKNILGRCAEQHSANRLSLNQELRNQEEVDSFTFSETVRPRTLEILRSCSNCKRIFPQL